MAGQEERTWEEDVQTLKTNSGPPGLEIPESCSWHMVSCQGTSSWLLTRRKGTPRRSQRGTLLSKGSRAGSSDGTSVLCTSHLAFS